MAIVKVEISLPHRLSQEAQLKIVTPDYIAVVAMHLRAEFASKQLGSSSFQVNAIQHSRELCHSHTFRITSYSLKPGRKFFILT